MDSVVVGGRTAATGGAVGSTPDASRAIAVGPAADGFRAGVELTKGGAGLALTAGAVGAAPVSVPEPARRERAEATASERRAADRRRQIRVDESIRTRGFAVVPEIIGGA